MILSAAAIGIAAIAGSPATCADSLYSEWKNSAKAKRIVLANRIVRELNNDNLQEDTLALFGDNENAVRMETLVHYDMGMHYIDQARFDDAVNCALKALDAASGLEDDGLLSDIYSLLSVGYSYLGNYAEALAFQQKGYEIDRRSGNDAALSSDLNTLAGLYLLCHDAESAKSYIDKAIGIERRLDRKGPLAIRLGMAADIYCETGELDKALEYAEEAFALDSLYGIETKAAVRKSQMAEIYIKKGMSATAESLLAEAIPLLQHGGSRHSLAVACVQMGNISMKNDDRASAAKWFKNALEQAQSTGNRYIESKSEFGLWQSLKDSSPSTAASYLESYAAHKDTMFRKELADALEANRVKYGAAALAEHIAHEKQRNRMIGTSAGIAVISLILIIAILLYAYSIKSRHAALLSEMERVRTDFFTNMTHEFRTPLTVILGYAKEMKDGTLPHGISLSRLGEIIYSEGNGMLALITELLDISKVRLSTGTQDWKHGNIVAYIQMLVDKHAIEAERKRVSLTYIPAETSVEMDFTPEYFLKVMNNLISNAIKFTPADGCIEVSSHTCKNSLIIKVSDTGIGIPKDDLPIIFDEFYRGSNGKGHVGSGIGLALARQIVLSVGGDISVESDVGKGSVFTVILPLSHGDRPLPAFVPDGMVQPDVFRHGTGNSGTAQMTPELPRTGKTASVLIVEDNLAVMRLIGSALGDCYSIIYASNGTDAMERAKSSIPDLVITDVMMPRMDGVEFCRNIRREPLTSHIPVIIVSARSTDEDRINGINAGADAYLAKPFNPDELASMARHILESRKHLRKKFSRAFEAGMNPKEDMSPSDKDFLDRFDRILDGLMADCSVDVESIAERFCITRKQLTKKVSAITGENTIDYITHLRIQRACSLLDDDGNLPIAEVALKCGYDDNAYFSRIFRQMTGMTPSQYRKQKSSLQ